MALVLILYASMTFLTLGTNTGRNLDYRCQKIGRISWVTL